MQPAVPTLLIVGIDIDPTYEEDFNLWYDTEHVPELRQTPGVVAVKRYELIDGSLGEVGPKYLALYELENAEVMLGPGYRTKPSTPWQSKLRPHWRLVIRAVYVRREGTLKQPPEGSAK